MNDPDFSLRLSDAQRLDWLRLSRTEGVGPRTFRALVNRFGGAGAALEALPDLSRARGKAVTPYPKAQAEREMTAAARLGVRYLCAGESDYPRALAATADPPPVIGARGRIETLSQPQVAVVGSRNASALGLAFAGRLAKAFGEAGFVVVSGLARGIDAAAHEASLSSGGVAVLAGGQDKVYPPEHADLAARLAENGCVVCEMPLGWVARGRDFPRRNRIISGLSLGVVVVEASRRSGSLITARFALEQGRDVFAVPGSPLDPRAEGPNDLIREGATLVRRAEDVIEALLPLVEAGATAPSLMAQEQPETPSEPLWDELDLFDDASAPRAASASGAVWRDPGDEAEEDGERASLNAIDVVLAALTTAGAAVDDLVRATRLEPSEVAYALMELELSGRVTREGRLFSRLG